MDQLIETERARILLAHCQAKDPGNYGKVTVPDFREALHASYDIERELGQLENDEVGDYIREAEDETVTEPVKEADGSIVEKKSLYILYKKTITAWTNGAITF